MSLRRLALASLAPLALAAQQPVTKDARPLVGFTPANAARESAAEAAAIARPDPARARAHSRALSAETHVAGTPAQARTRDYVIAEMKKLGLETEVRAYRVWMPHATAVHVWRLTPDGRSEELALAEPPVPGDSTSYLPQYPTVNGSSAAGDATGDVVYVNYGLIEDYAQLDSVGVSVRGKVVLARYGRSFRGIKAREAEKRGAVALLIYSDPADDGYVRGDVYPAGPMRNANGVQRGSVFNGDGDPCTPGYPSLPNAPCVSADRMGVPHIPVVPISYGNAARLLEPLGGAAIPASWQGGLPFRYHVGPGPVRARVQVRDDSATAAYKTIWDTFGVVRGAELPDELVIIGGHRDGWGPGAADNVSGTVSVLEAARAVAEQLKAGHRPRRTIVFATWDAEEWGLVGSTEYVEDDSLRLARHAVAYLNQDVAAQGPAFGGGGSPSLRAVLRDVASTVPDPSGRGSVYDVWRRRAGVVDTATPNMGDPGGGSDFAGFYNHLGIPIAEWGFGGAGGVYHSQYDSYAWMTKFGDPTYAYHAAAARVAAGMVLRLADADVLPYDYVEYARTLRRYVGPIVRSLATRGWTGTPGGAQPSLAPVSAALDRMERAAADFAAARDARLATPNAPTRQSLAAANEALKQVERALTRPEGLRTRPWFRNLVYASDEDNGYANIPLPSVSEAARAGDRTLLEREIADLAGRIDAATAALGRAVEALR
ncbi:M20/M25/M40 family metallo-hydrolase [Gemmatirosa kalamazoonensis]|uniref:M20/M25/M40 family metallo-hydrolase n=1 Tax=Gemmatirosa kalamazoonensis TaxID=861299 RepID=UPI00046D028E|nr:M20/M25/M40 family metallo-hydrolase [Gemmatirosa kalamazoonensis]